MPRYRIARISPVSSSSVPYAITEDQALIGDTRHPLHHKPLPKRGGAHGEEVTYTTPVKGTVPNLHAFNEAEEGDGEAGY